LAAHLAGAGERVKCGLAMPEPRFAVRRRSPDLIAGMRINLLKSQAYSRETQFHSGAKHAMAGYPPDEF
jgi:hypothetical protein